MIFVLLQDLAFSCFSVGRSTFTTVPTTTSPTTSPEPTRTPPPVPTYERMFYLKRDNFGSAVQGFFAPASVINNTVVCFLNAKSCAATSARVAVNGEDVGIVSFRSYPAFASFLSRNVLLSFFFKATLSSNRVGEKSLLCVMFWFGLV